MKRELIKTILQIVKILVDVAKGIHHLNNTILLLASRPSDTTVGLTLPSTICYEVRVLQQVCAVVAIGLRVSLSLQEQLLQISRFSFNLGIVEQTFVKNIASTTIAVVFACGRSSLVGRIVGKQHHLVALTLGGAQEDDDLCEQLAILLISCHTRFHRLRGSVEVGERLFQRLSCSGRLECLNSRLVGSIDRLLTADFALVEHTFIVRLTLQSAAHQQFVSLGGIA